MMEDGQTAKKRKVIAKSPVTVDDTTLKRLGQKARERFQEERSKRKEIVRLEETIVPITKRKTAATSNTNLKQPEKTSLQQHQQQKQQTITKDENDETSRVVEMMGLPLNVGTYQNVISFWNGLNVAELFILPAQKANAIYCRFDSPATATFACQRSGECVKISNQSYTIHVTKRFVVDSTIQMVFTHNGHSHKKNQTFYESWKKVKSMLSPTLIPFLTNQCNHNTDNIIEKHQPIIKYTGEKDLKCMVQQYNADCETLETYQKDIQKLPFQYDPKMGDIYRTVYQLLQCAEFNLENRLDAMERFFYSHNNKLPYIS